MQKIQRRFASSTAHSIFPRWTFDNPDQFSFEIVYQSKHSNARVGRIHTAHGVIDTPGFVPVGTNGALKAMSNRDARETGCQLMFANTYHLILQPGPDVIQKAGGIHSFMGRVGVGCKAGEFSSAPQLAASAIITDSGGFQVFSMASSEHDLDPNASLKASSGDRHKTSNARRGHSFRKLGEPLVKVTESGVFFRSYRDGKRVFLSPEISVQAQQSFGSDIIIPLDELLPYSSSPTQVEESMHRTHRWEHRSLVEHLKPANKTQAMYAVLHGGTEPELRSQSLDLLSSWPFDGWAIGGSMGASRNDMFKLLTKLGPMMRSKQVELSRNIPIHLLGIGDPQSVQQGVQFGIDTFDSCYPTRVARHGQVIIPNEMRIGDFDQLRLLHARFRDDHAVLSQSCECSTCRGGYTRSYLHHLLKAKEPLVAMLLSVHNVFQMNVAMCRLRGSILAGEL